MMDEKNIIDSYEEDDADSYSYNGEDSYEKDFEDYCDKEDQEDDYDDEEAEEKEDPRTVASNLRKGILTDAQRNALKEKLLVQEAVQMDRDEFRALNENERLRMIAPVREILYELCYDGIAVGDDPKNTSIQNNIIDGTRVRRFNRNLECIVSCKSALLGYDRTRGEANFLTYFITCYKNECSQARGKDAQGQDAVTGRRKLTGKGLAIEQKGKEMFDGKRLHELSYTQRVQLAQAFSEGKEKKDQVALSKLCELAVQRQYAVSLDQPVSQGDGDGEALEGSDVCGTVDAGYEQTEREEQHEQMRQRIDALPEDTKKGSARMQKLLITANLLNELREVPPAVVCKVLDKANAGKVIDFSFVAYLYNIPEGQATLAYIIDNPPTETITDRKIAAFYDCTPTYVTGIRKKLGYLKK